MDAAAAAPGVGVTLEQPIMSEIDIGGLTLLTEALLDGQQQPTDKEEDDAVALPLSTGELSQPIPDNSELNKHAEGEFIQNNFDHQLPFPSHQQLENAILAPPEGVEPDLGHVLAEPIEIRDVLIPTPVFVAQSGEHIHGQAQQGGDIAAYFALEFLDMQYIYYLQRSSVSLGRSSTLSHDSGGADIDLGPLKNISRLHARIEYEEEINGFVLAVIGRNGAFVDGAWIEPGRRVPLGDRTLVQISTRAFYFILPNNGPPLPTDPAHLQSPEHEVPALDSTVTTAEDDDSHSTSASATPKQRIRIPRRHHDHDEDDEDEDEDVDIELHDNGLYHPIASKGKGKGKEAMGPPKRGRGRPRKNPLLANSTSKPKPKPRIRTPDDDEDDMAMMEILDESDEDERDSGDDFVPKNVKRSRRGGYGGGGKTRSGASTRPMGTTSRPRIRAESLIRPRSESVVEGVKDEEMSESLEPIDDGDLFEDVVMDEAGNPLSPSVNKRAPKRKRELEDGVEEGGPDKRRKSISSGSKPGKPKPVKAVKKEGDQQQQQPKRKKAPKPEMKSLFTTTPAPSLSSVIASKESALAAEGGGASAAGGADGDSKGKLGAGKKKDKGKSKKKDEIDGADENDEEGEKKDGVGEGEAAKKDLGPPPPKPPFTYPLLCYKALKALNGKAPYRAITKWLEQEYPYFAFATKEGKDGWENSTRHTLSSHRAFIKIDRKPEERGKGCFWSFDPEFEEQFKDQWMAAESQSRNPRPRPGPNAPGPSNIPGSGPMSMYPRPPFGPPPGGWSGVTPPHLMPGYRPVPGSSGQPPHPHPFPYPMGRPPIGAPGGPSGPVGPGGMPFPGPPFGPPPPPGHPMHGHHPPMGPPGVGGPGSINGPPKARAPKKPKQALGAAFSRAPLIRPGLGGVPAKTDSGSPTVPAASGGGGNNLGGAGPSKVDELVMRGEHVARLAARVAKDEIAGRAHPGAAMSVIMGGWGPPPPLGGVNGTAKGKMGMGRPPPVGTKTTVVLAVPPVEALPVMPSPTPLVKAPSDSKDAAAGNDATSPTSTDKEKEKAIASPPPTPAARPPIPIQMPIVFYDGKLYINPKAYPLVKDTDVQSLENMPLSEVLGFLGGKAGVIPLGVAKPIPSGKAEEKNAEPNGEDKTAIEAQASDSSEGSKTE